MTSLLADFKPLTIFIGGHGSGKSELALAFIMKLKEMGETPLTFIDLDIIKPMFRGRTAREFLEGHGINLFASRSRHSDLPMIGPEIGGALAGGKGWRVVDCGGDAQGARVLRSLADHFMGQAHDVWYVTNIMRPFNRDEKEVNSEVLRIQEIGSVKITGLISNSHLLGKENLDLIRHGIDITKLVGEKLGIPLRFIGVNETAASEVADVAGDIPLLIVGHHIGFDMGLTEDYGAFGI